MRPRYRFDICASSCPATHPHGQPLVMTSMDNAAPAVWTRAGWTPHKSDAGVPSPCIYQSRSILISVRNAGQKHGVHPLTVQLHHSFFHTINLTQHDAGLGHDIYWFLSVTNIMRTYPTWFEGVTQSCTRLQVSPIAHRQVDRRAHGAARAHDRALLGVYALLAAPEQRSLRHSFGIKWHVLLPTTA